MMREANLVLAQLVFFVIDLVGVLRWINV